MNKRNHKLKTHRKDHTSNEGINTKQTTNVKTKYGHNTEEDKDCDGCCYHRNKLTFHWSMSCVGVFHHIFIEKIVADKTSFQMYVTLLQTYSVSLAILNLLIVGHPISGTQNWRLQDLNNLCCLNTWKNTIQVH